MIEKYLNYLDDGYIPSNELMITWLCNIRPWNTNSLKNLLFYAIDISNLYVISLTEYDIPLGSIKYKEGEIINLVLTNQEINFLFNSSELILAIMKGKDIPKGKNRSKKEIKDLITRLDNLAEIPTNYIDEDHWVTIPKLVKSYEYDEVSGNLSIDIDVNFIELMYTWGKLEE